MIESPPEAAPTAATPAIDPPPGSAIDPTDEALLRRYRRSRSPDDLAEIASRHREMVFRATLRLTGNAHDAEDATQAVFLALARRPEIIRRSLAGGLHELSRAAASELFRSRRRRSRREEEAARRGPTPDAPGRAAPDPDAREIREELDAALDRLPDRLKQAVVLRHLEGYGQDEAARLAGCTPAALGWRAAKGLDRLRAILARRGVGVAGGALAAALAGEGSASVARGAVAASAKAASVKAAQALVGRSAVAALGRLATLGLAVATPAAVVTVGVATRPAAPPRAVAPPPAPPVASTMVGLFDRTLDVGAPGRAGEARFADGRYTVRGGGARIYLDRDHFHFVARPWDGDGTITARVTFDPEQKGRQVAAGVMFRERPDAESRHVAMMVTGVETRVTYRTDRTLPHSHVHIDDLPARGVQWVRMTRRGDHFTVAVRSEALADWRTIQELDIPLARSLLVGLAVTANDDSELSTAEFDRVSCEAAAGPDPTSPGP